MMIWKMAGMAVLLRGGEVRLPSGRGTINRNNRQRRRVSNRRLDSEPLPGSPSKER